MTRRGEWRLRLRGKMCACMVEVMSSQVIYKLARTTSAQWTRRWFCMLLKPTSVISILHSPGSWITAYMGLVNCDTSSTDRHLGPASLLCGQHECFATIAGTAPHSKVKSVKSPIARSHGPQQKNSSKREWERPILWALRVVLTTSLKCLNGPSLTLHSRKAKMSGQQPYRISIFVWTVTPYFFHTRFQTRTRYASSQTCCISLFMPKADVRQIPK